MGHDLLLQEGCAEEVGEIEGSYKKEKLAPCPNCATPYDADSLYCPNCGFSGKNDCGLNLTFLAASFIPGAMATCSVSIIATTFDWIRKEKYRGAEEIVAEVSTFVLFVALIILLFVLHSMFVAAFRGRINFKTLLPTFIVLPIGCVILGGISLWGTQLATSQGEVVFLWASGSLCALIVLDMVYFLIRDYKRTHKK